MEAMYELLQMPHARKVVLKPLQPEKRDLHYCDDAEAVTDKNHPDYARIYKVRLLVGSLKN